MLLKIFLNGVCSLNLFEDKLIFFIFMEIDYKGNVVKYEICEFVINLKVRMIYIEVFDILEKDDEKFKKIFEYVVEDFKNVEILVRIFMLRREKRGVIDFNFLEVKIILNGKGEVVDIKLYERRIFNKIIEEFMFISNEIIVEYFYWMGILFVYRIYEILFLEKMEELSKFIFIFGYIIKGDKEEVYLKVL